jgi:hypothetical protein
VAWIAAFTAGVALVLAPVALRNRHVGGEMVLTTAQLGPNFYIGNRTGASGLYEPLRPLRGDPMHEREDAIALAAEALGHAPTPAEVSDYWLGRTLTEIARAPLSWLRLMSWKWLLMERARDRRLGGHGRLCEQSPLLRMLDLLLGFGVLCRWRRSASGRRGGTGGGWRCCRPAAGECVLDRAVLRLRPLPPVDGAAGDAVRRGWRARARRSVAGTAHG